MPQRSHLLLRHNALAPLFSLLVRSVFWVTRNKSNMQLRVVGKRLRHPQGRILRDDEVVLVAARPRGE